MTLRSSLRTLAVVWSRVPVSVRKTIVFTIGGTLVVLGIALVVLPGPFTLPLLIAGFALLGTEFAWAARVLERTKEAMEASGRVARSAGSKVAGTARRIRGRRTS